MANGQSSSRRYHLALLSCAGLSSERSPCETLSSTFHATGTKKSNPSHVCTKVVTFDINPTENRKPLKSESIPVYFCTENNWRGHLGSSYEPRVINPLLQWNKSCRRFATSFRIRVAAAFILPLLTFITTLYKALKFRLSRIIYNRSTDARRKGKINGPTEKLLGKEKHAKSSPFRPMH